MSAQKVPSGQVCCITLNMKDRLRLLGCSPDIIPEFRQAIQQSWGTIQGESEYHGSHEFKLKGNPWQGRGTEAVPARRLLTAVLSTMAKNGWNLIQVSNISKKLSSKDSLFFERSKPDPDVRMFAVSFNMTNCIRIIDAPELMPYLKDAVKSSWPKGITNEKEYCGSSELTLGGTPWHCGGKQRVESVLLFCQILGNFRLVGYKLYASVDMSEGPTQTVDGNVLLGGMESWVFRKVNENWE